MRKGKFFCSFELFAEKILYNEGMQGLSVKQSKGRGCQRGQLKKSGGKKNHPKNTLAPRFRSHTKREE